MLACIFFSHKEYAEIPIFLQQTNHRVRAFKMDISLESVTCSSFMKRLVVRKISENGLQVSFLQFSTIHVSECHVQF